MQAASATTEQAAARPGTGAGPPPAQPEDARHHSSFGWPHQRERLPGRAMAPAGDGNGLELSRMDRIDAPSQQSSDEQSDAASENDGPTKTFPQKVYGIASMSWVKTWDWIKL